MACWSLQLLLVKSPTINSLQLKLSFLFISCQFLYFGALLLGRYVFICVIFLVIWPFYDYKMFLFISSIFVLKSILSETCVATPTFLWWLFAWDNFFILSLAKWKCIFESKGCFLKTVYSLTISAFWLGLTMSAFWLGCLIYSCVVIDLVGFTSAILLFFFCVSQVFHGPLFFIHCVFV